MQLLRAADAADPAAAEPATDVPSETGLAEAVSETADAGPPGAPAKPAPEPAGTAGPGPKASRWAKPSSVPDAAAGSATDPAVAGVAPLPVALPLTIHAEPPAVRTPMQQNTAAGGETETTAVSTAAPRTAERPAQDTAAVSPAGMPEAAAQAGPAETSHASRAAVRAVDASARATSAPAAPAIAFAAMPAEPVATTQAASAPTVAGHATPPAVAPPAAQVGSALLTLGPAADGSQQMTLRLHPAELGVVQVQIGRSETGAAHVEITAERADTMQALQRDQVQLHRALDDAGVPAAGRTVTFHTAPVQPAAAGGNDSGSLPSNQGGTGTMNGNSAQGSGKGAYGGGSEPGGDTAGRRQTRSSAEKMVATTAISFRVGIDIVA
nr:flagellar hook-length control protein FliK [uncultured Rhodopila sp.]